VLAGVVLVLVLAGSSWAAGGKDDPGRCMALRSGSKAACLRIVAEVATERTLGMRPPDRLDVRCAGGPGSAPLVWLCAWMLNGDPTVAGRSRVVFYKQRAARGATDWRSTVSVKSGCSLAGAPLEATYAVWSTAPTANGCPP
jgi:hypothetical protein